MNVLFSKNFWLYLLLIAVSVTSFVGYRIYLQNQVEPTETTQVTNNTVEQTVTVSGKIEAKKIARLGFAFSGTIQNIYKSAGENVKEGEVIASLTSSALVAEYSAALSRVKALDQSRQQLVRGATEEEKKVARTNVQIATTKLANAEKDFAQIVNNARQSLLSTGLQAYPTNINNNDVPPTITGSYTCKDEGSYTLSLFPSNAGSGLSYYLNGLSSGTYTANFDTPTPLGDCGLFIQFALGENYRTDDWVVSIPNKRSSSYVTLKNNYDLAVAEAESGIKAAKEALELAKDNEEVILSPVTTELLSEADARVREAEAQLIAQDARVSDYTIRAPFDGIITDVSMKVGEPTGPNHSITIVYEGEYELKARIPEIDITKVKVGNNVKVKFDADPNEEFTANIAFISPISSDIGGVAYYDAYINLDKDPTWLREGLNADVIIESQKKVGVPTLPKRFLIFNPDGTFVLQRSGDLIVKTQIATGLVGTDGFAEIIDLPVGSEVLLP
ncbi:MAG: efflux RND transporter periplasmic adaptor subunit [Candidatus Paceibacterota bacterium]